MKSWRSHLEIAGVVLSLLLLSGVLTYLGWNTVHFYSQPSRRRLEVLWARDLDQLRQAKILPKGFQQIRDIRVTPGSEQAQKWLPDLKIPVIADPHGDHRLEILLLTWAEDQTEAAIVQYDLVDLKSQNMVWELGRTYILKGNHSTEEKIALSLRNLFGISPITE